LDFSQVPDLFFGVSESAAASLNPGFFPFTMVGGAGSLGAE
jgi:hypothetical protein